ncbi:MAG TPA: hypothetical protein VK735_18800 [Pseudonocardia sp.]|uniref:hypothetical protein n=1 Tax=Pseudonocardia sp. TaxID=60912 RepID=UPI002C7FC2A7|nr:hypothetical protein [Pseudonocardia sp.]HTF49497.1 hypothetical protein [Pseudonocardia sp.]
MKDSTGKHITSCARKACTDVADAQRGVQTRHGEKLCPTHGEVALTRPPNRR